MCQISILEQKLSAWRFIILTVLSDQDPSNARMRLARLRNFKDALKLERWVYLVERIPLRKDVAEAARVELLSGRLERLQHLARRKRLVNWKLLIGHLTARPGNCT